MKEKGFTLIELLAVIVILAIIALIATPIVLNIISDSKDSASLRSAEMYLSAVEYGISDKVMDNKTIPNGTHTIMEKGNICIGTYNNKNCIGDIIEVQVNGEVPKEGSTITIEAGKIKYINLLYGDKTIIKDSNGNLVYSGEDNELDMSTASATLEENDWETIQKVVKAGKTAEAGWSVGDTKTLEINGQTKEATIIGINHDGENTATFMVMSNIGSRAMNDENTNAGGWAESDMRAWLNSNIYESMNNKVYIKEVTKITNNIGQGGNIATETSDKVFLLSPKEIGIEWQIAHEDYWDNPDYPYIDMINSEGITYDWFKTNSIGYGGFWFRSPHPSSDSKFFSYQSGVFGNDKASDRAIDVFPTFVIG